jgi:hypothetical protein
VKWTGEVAGEVGEGVIKLCFSTEYQQQVERRIHLTRASEAGPQSFFAVTSVVLQTLSAWGS